MTRKPATMDNRGQKQIDTPWYGVAGGLVTLLSLCWCVDLLNAWKHSPMDQCGWVALLIWLTPLLIFATQANSPLRLDSRRIVVFIVALSIGALGRLTSLHVLQHIGLTIALAGWLGGFRWTVVAWSSCAVCWMPAFGWATSKVAPSEVVLASRLILAILGASTLVRYRSEERTLALPSHRFAWLTLGGFVVASLVWQFVPLQGAEYRLMLLPTRGIGFTSQGAALSAPEVKSLGAAIAVRRMYHFDDQRLIATLVDATQNRHAVHDPLYCFTGSGWKVSNDRPIPVPAGTARHIAFERRGKRAELIFWFSDGKTRHASMSQYWWQTTLRRLTLGRCGDEPVLVLLQSYDADPIDWRPVLDVNSPFFQL